MARVSIIGSCATRDMWPIVGDPPKDLLYISRTSLPSIMSQPPEKEIIISNTGALGEFKKRCVASDLDKSNLARLKQFRPDVILIDFIDERFDLLQIGASIISYTHEFVEGTRLEEGGLAAVGRLIDRLSDEASSLWEEGAKKFSHELRSDQSLSNAKIVIHCAPWVTQTVEGFDLADGAPVSALPERQFVVKGKYVNARLYASLMQSYYKIFSELMPEATYIVADSKFYFSASMHRWRPTPYHYVSGYYRDVYKKMIDVGVRF